jgi:hypothetical protein
MEQVLDNFIILILSLSEIIFVIYCISRSWIFCFCVRLWWRTAWGFDLPVFWGGFLFLGDRSYGVSMRMLMLWDNIV